MDNHHLFHRLHGRLRRFLIGLSRPTKRLVVAASDIAGLTICACGTLWLLTGSSAFLTSPSLACVGVAIVAMAFAWTLGLYRSVVRYVGLELVAAASKTSLGASAAGAIVMATTGTTTSPLRWFIVFWTVSFVYVCGSRFLARVFLITQRATADRERVVIYGAGASGSQLAISLLGGDEYRPVAMLDDDSSLHGSVVKGLLVHSPKELEQIVEDTGATRVLLAIPSASRRRRRDVLQFLSDFPVHIQTMPGLDDLVTGKAKVDDLREVAVEDLLGRDPVPPNTKLLDATIRGKNVMVSGAGGSIGSELCRQIIRLEPSVLVLFELSEFSLYSIETELKSIAAETGSGCKIVPLLGSVHHGQRVQEVLETFAVDTVYHAAAYKHVPIVEHNILEGVHNNVIGTWNLAQAAAAAKVSSFVLISTDKAVSPTNVMGATKRMAELVLQALQDDFAGTRFCMVRFGNVLESSGSVVPLFRKQIRSGGPVTVTHPQIIRYFMTIPEAAQLVIQAASMARGGDVFVLDMGAPVRILDLAKRMIHLMGLTVREEENPDGDIAIEFTGLRPAEKLYEELLIGNDVSGTDHPRIMRAQENKLELGQIYRYIDELQQASDALDREETREILMRAVSEYAPGNSVEDLVTVNKKVVGGEKHSATIVGFPGTDTD